MLAKLGIVAGDRALPGEIVSHARDENIPFLIAGIDGAYTGVSDRSFKLAELAELIKFFKERGVDRVVLAGGVHRARVGFSPMLLKFAARLLFMKNRYDGVLRLVVSEFEKAGMKVVGIHELLPSLLIEPGVMGEVSPTDEALSDIKLVWGEAQRFAATDAGQSVVMRDGKIVATERFAGTDELIRRAGSLPGAVLIKMPKPGQEMRADIPVIGVGTVAGAKKNGYRGIAVAAGGAIVEDRAATIEAANDAGIFIIGV